MLEYMVYLAINQCEIISIMWGFIALADGQA